LYANANILSHDRISVSSRHWKENAMVVDISKRRFDDQLDAVLDEPGAWTVNGPRDTILCEAASLRIATEKAVAFAARGHEIVALVHRSPPGIIVFASQLRRLAHRIAEPTYYASALQA
jgi:hypothetical protein